MPLYLFQNAVFLGHACTCKSGRKQVGCCIHSAVLILYLSHAQYHDLFLPGQHLMSVLVDLDKKESPNKPRYVRHKRRRALSYPINIRHPDEWNELELKNYVRTNSAKLKNWFNENYVSEAFTPRSLCENNIVQHYFTFDQQIVLGLEIVQTMQEEVNTNDERIYRFITTRMFQQIMSEIVKSIYSCDFDEMKRYINYVAEYQRDTDSPNDYYLETIKKFQLLRFNDWLLQQKK